MIAYWPPAGRLKMHDLSNAVETRTKSQGLENAGASHFSSSDASIISVQQNKVIPANLNAMFITSYEKFRVCMFH